MKSQSSSHPPANLAKQDQSSSTNDEGPSDNPHQTGHEIQRSLHDSIKHRVLYLSEQLKVEKNSRDENTMGYLKLVSKADRHQATHIRQAFEKVNQRSSATIANIERKLRQYHLQLQEMEEDKIPQYSEPKEEKTSKRKECNKKVPSVENSKPGAEESQTINRVAAIEEEVLASLPQEKSSKKDVMSQQQSLLFQRMKEELEDIKVSHSKLDLSYQALKERYLTDLQFIVESLQEEKHRQKVIEQQVNDHMQGHLGEISRIKQNLACTEEKMVYLSYERAKEIWEVMGTFQKRISKLETQQQVTQQEMTQKLPNHPQVFLSQFMSFLLILSTIILVCVSTICTCPLPFFKCRLRTCAVLFVIGLGMVTWQKWYSIPYMYWHEWILSRWKFYSRDSKPLPN